MVVELCVIFQVCHSFQPASKRISSSLEIPWITNLIIMIMGERILLVIVKFCARKQHPAYGSTGTRTSDAISRWQRAPRREKSRVVLQAQDFVMASIIARIFFQSNGLKQNLTTPLPNWWLNVYLDVWDGLRSGLPNMGHRSCIEVASKLHLSLSKLHLTLWYLHISCI